MLNPNVPKIRSEYERIENTLAELTPDPRDFVGWTYPAEDVESDIELLDNFRHTPEYKKSEARSDAKLLEKTFTDMAERDDWFGEQEAYGDDPDYVALVTFPAADIDDTFNHIDVICMIGNKSTDHKIVPFAIDLTYNTDGTKMAQKFRWKHVRGKKETAPSKISEFGGSYMGKGQSGQSVLRTRPLPLELRDGLKIPGFASVKYFEDKNNPWDPIHEKGRIEIMPRFIVGYSADIADVLSSGMPTDEYRKKYGEEAYQKKRAGYKNAERRAKWCTLFECKKQASDIRSMLEQMNADEIQLMGHEEFKKAHEQIIAMDVYFAKAIELATEKAQTDPDEMAAMEYTYRDTVCQAIIQHSHDTYILKSWE